MLWRVSRRHLARHPWQIGLSVLGVALGVAVALSIDLANGSARRAFALATEAVTGRTTHQIVGGPIGLDETLYRTLRVALGVRDAAPVVAADVAAPAFPGRTFHLFGIDPLVEPAFRPHLTAASAGGGIRSGRDRFALLVELLTRPGTALISARTARDLGLAPGDPLEIRAGGARRRLRLVALVTPDDELSARALASLLVTDVATAQEVLGVPGRLTRIDLIVPEGERGRALLARVAGALPPGAEVVPAAARAEATVRMTRAFSLNLAALSLLALVVGTFLIYNTMTFSVVQRRTLIGTLRALGVTRGEIFTLIATEALAIGVVGTAAGALLGLGLARGLLALVTRTINDLFFVVSVSEVSVTPAAIAKAVALGIGATLIAAVAPALEATGAAPRAVLSRGTLEARARWAAPRLAWIGVAAALAGSLLLLAGGGVGVGFVGLFVLILACALVTPLAVLGLSRLAAPPAGWMFGAVGRMAARGISGALSRTAVAVTALMVAVSATIGVGLMITSFRGAVVRWLEGTLRSDVYVSPPSLIGSRSEAPLDPALVDRLTRTPGVAGASTSRVSVVPGPQGPVSVVALGLGRGRRPGFPLSGGDPGTVWAAFDRGAVLVSEPFASRHRTRPGDTVRLRTDRGEREFPVAGVFYDYGSSAGVVLMRRETYDRHWDDRAVSGLGLEAGPGVDVGRLVDALRARVGPGHEVVIRSNRALREASLEIFDRTFAITTVLRLLTVVVAFIGVLSALLAQQLERVREIGVLRALGLTPRQVWSMVTMQTGLVGLIAGLLALPVGVLLAFVLIFVINQRSFGWTMPLEVRADVLLQGLLLAVAAGLLAGLYPARRMARASPSEALRDE